MYICIFEVVRARQHLRSLAPVMIDDDNDGQMIFGDLGGLKLPDICLTGEEKPRKSLTQETCPDRGSNPARCVTVAHVTACSTAVDGSMRTCIVVQQIPRENLPLRQDNLRSHRPGENE